MPVSQRTRVYEDWRKGVYGSGDDSEGEFNARNAQVYQNGTLGPRPGWKLWAQSGQDYVVANDAPRGFVFFDDETNDPRLLVTYADASDSNNLKTEVGDINTGTDTISWSTVVNINTGAGYPAGAYQAPRVGTSPLPHFWDRVALVNIGARIFTDAPSTSDAPPNTADGYAHAVTIYRERAYYWGITGFPGRIYYSDAGDYTTVGATSFFDVSIDPTLTTAAVTGLYSISNALIITRKDGRWLVLSGTSPENGTLGELGLDPVPDLVSAATVDNQLYFLNRSGTGVVVAVPGQVEAQVYEYLSPVRFPDASSDLPLLTLQRERAVGDEITRGIFLPAWQDGNTKDPLIAVERVNDAWTYSTWALDDYTAVDMIDFQLGYPNVLWAEVDDDGASWNFHSRNFTLNRPGKTTDDYSTTLTAEDGPNATASTMQVVLGTIIAEGDSWVRPKKVVLDIDYWKGTGYQAPSITVDATVKGTENATSEASCTQKTIASTSWDNAEGSKQRVEVAIEPLPWAQEIVVEIGGDGFAIDVARIYYEQRDDTR